MHKKDKKKILSILLIPDNQEVPPKNFRIRYSTLNIVFAVLGVFFISIVYGIVTYSQVLQKASLKDKQDQELIRLKEQLRISSQLQAQLDTVKAYRDKISNSFQGYVKFVDKKDEELLADKNLILSDVNKVSIFKNIPLKTPVSGFVSQEFNDVSHTGIDIVAPVGNPVQAAADGVVIFSGWTHEDGFVLILYHPGGYLTHYRHNSQNLVDTGMAVKQGARIALLGNSGELSSGPHLHFEIWKDGKPCNPREFLLDLNLGE